MNITACYLGENQLECEFPAPLRTGPPIRWLISILSVGSQQIANQEIDHSLALMRKNLRKFYNTSKILNIYPILLTVNARPHLKSYTLSLTWLIYHRSSFARTDWSGYPRHSHFCSAYPQYPPALPANDDYQPVPSPYHPD